MTFPELEPGVEVPADPPAPDDTVSSSFDGIPFSWKPGGPVWEKRDGLDHYSGSIICFRPADVSALEQRYRPVTITTAGDGMNVYVDYWGTDPSHVLYVMGQHIADHAILMSFRQSDYGFQLVVPTPGDFRRYGIATVDVDFVITDAAAESGGGGGTTGGGGGGDVVGPGSMVPIASDTANTQAYSLWNPDTSDNFSPPTDWFDPSYDSGWWMPGITADTGGTAWRAYSQAVWSGATQDSTEQTLFRHSFSLNVTTITAAQLVVLGDCTVTVWVNGTEVATDQVYFPTLGSVTITNSLFDVSGPNLVSIQATARDASAWLSYYLTLNYT